MVTRIQFPRPLAETMYEYIAETFDPTGDPTVNYTVWCLPAAGVVSREWA